MTTQQLSSIKAAASGFGCTFTENEKLSRCTTFGIGGSCPLMIDINGEEALSRIVKTLKSENIPYYVIGKGSNLLADDNDIDMVFLRMGKAFSEISVNGCTVTCQAGAALSSVCNAAAKAELTGLEFAYGIPGNIGGAVYMNAGAYGGEMKDIVKSVTAVDTDGNIVGFSAEELDFGYRHSIFCDNKFIVTRAVLELEKGNAADISGKMNELTAKRKEKQPLEYRSAGSTFKRPAGTFAGLLIEQCGLKGYSFGGAQVSEKHCGFVINKDNATFDDVMQLIKHVQKTVHEKTGYMLECEPEIITTRTLEY